MYFYNVFSQRHFTYVNLYMVCIFTTLFYIWYVFFQRIFTYGMCLFNVFFDQANFEVSPPKTHMFFYICISTTFQSGIFPVPPSCPPPPLPSSSPVLAAAAAIVEMDTFCFLVWWPSVTKSDASWVQSMDTPLDKSLFYPSRKGT